MPFFIPALIAGLSAVGGALANRGRNVTQKQDTTANIDNFSMPAYDQKTATTRDRILNELLSSYEGDTDLSGYTAGGLNRIAGGADIKGRALNSFFTSRGLGSSPMAASGLAGLNAERIGDQVNFLNEIPLKQRELKRQSLGDLSGFFSSLPVGQHNYGTTTTSSTGNVNQPGNMWGGGISSLATTLAGLFGQGAFSQQKPKVPGSDLNV